jgi:hypothetical protein
MKRRDFIKSSAVIPIGGMFVNELEASVPVSQPKEGLIWDPDRKQRLAEYEHQVDIYRYKWMRNEAIKKALGFDSYIRKNEHDFQIQACSLLENWDQARAKHWPSDNEQDKHVFKILLKFLRYNEIQQLVDFKTASSQSHNVYNFMDGLKSESISLDFVKTKVGFCMEAAKDLKAVFNLDPVEELTSVIAQEKQYFLNRMVFQDLIKCSKKVDNTGLWSLIDEQVYAFKKLFHDNFNSPTLHCALDQRLRNAFWIIVPPEALHQICNREDFFPYEEGIYSSLSLREAGLLRRDHKDVNCIRVFVYPLAPTSNVLVGAKLGNHGSGYTVCPYTITELTDPQPDDFMPRKYFQWKIGKHLHKDHKMWYKTIRCNFHEDTNEKLKV